MTGFTPLNKNTESQSTMSSATTASQASAANTSRPEKGVVKVDEHEVKEEAGALLCSFLAILEADKEETKTGYYEHSLPKVHEVIGKLGLDVTRIQAIGNHKAYIFEKQIIRTKSINKIKARSEYIQHLLDTMAGDLNEDGPASENRQEESKADNTTVRATRGRPTAKRVREEEELERAAEAIFADVKRLRGERAERVKAPRKSVG